MPNLLTRKEAAARLGITVMTLDAERSSGHLAYIQRKPGGKVWITEEAPMEIFTTEDGILIRPYKPGCICCGSSEDLVEFNGVSLCGACIHEFSERS